MYFVLIKKADIKVINNYDNTIHVKLSLDKITYLIAIRIIEIYAIIFINIFFYRQIIEKNNIKCN